MAAALKQRVQRQGQELQELDQIDPPAIRMAAPKNLPLKDYIRIATLLNGSQAFLPCMGYMIWSGSQCWQPSSYDLAFPRSTSLRDILQHQTRAITTQFICEVATTIATAAQYHIQHGIPSRFRVRPDMICVDDLGTVRIHQFASINMPFDGAVLGNPDSYRCLAPEQLTQQMHMYDAEKACLWPLGVIMLEMLLLRYPLTPDPNCGSGMFAELQNIACGPVPDLSVLSDMPITFVEIIDACLRRDPQLRPSLTDLLDALREVA